jgi:hypothetical protein
VRLRYGGAPLLRLPDAGNHQRTNQRRGFFAEQSLGQWHELNFVVVKCPVEV